MNSSSRLPFLAALKSSRRLRLGVVLAAAALVGAGLPGCLLVNNEHTTISGHDITPEVFAQIVQGKPKDFVVQQLGEPTERTKGDDGIEQWKWVYAMDHKTDTTFLFILPAKLEDKFQKTHYVEFKDGVVTKAWSD